MQTLHLHHPQNQKYITHCNAAREPNNSHGQHAQKIEHVAPEICTQCDKQTETLSQYSTHMHGWSMIIIYLLSPKRRH